MPSKLPVPTVADLRKAFRTGVLADRSAKADVRTGAIYDLFGGVGAMVFRRLALRDRDIFRSVYFHFAEGAALGKITESRFHLPPREASPGAGTALLARPSAAAGAGTFLSGTRIEVEPALAGPKAFYIVTEDVSVGAALSALVPVTAEVTGPGAAIDTQTGGGRPAIADLLWDPTWRVERLVCGEGEDREADEALRARILTDRTEGRPGYVKAITDACAKAGAKEIVLFGSDFLAQNPDSGEETIGNLDEDGYGDVGLNRVFVADASYNTSLALLRACRIAMDGIAIAGTAVQVQGMEPELVTVTATVRLWGDAGRFGVLQKKADAKAAILNYFQTRKNPYYFRAAALRGAILRAVRDVHAIDLEVSEEPDWRQVLGSVPIRRFYVTPSTVTVTVTGP